MCSAGSRQGRPIEQILDDFPELTENDIRACLAYAADRERRLDYRLDMKLLFDQNLSFKLCQTVADLFRESNHVGLLG